MYDTILLPTDGSAGSQRAIDHAVAIADEVDATIRALYVVDTTAFDSLGGAVRESIEERGERALDAVREPASRADIEVETLLRRGVPHDEILAAADDTGADAIVMGTNGRTGLDRIVLGSVTERVVREAAVPVITVRMVEDAPSIDGPEAAIERASEALADEGYEPVEPLDEPHRGTSSWIVPFRGADGEFRVHVDATTGKARIARNRN